MLKCLRMGVGFGYIYRIKKNHNLHPDDYWNKKIILLTQQMHIKKTVVLMESGITKIPLVIGHLKPVIYMPIGLLTNLPHDQVEAVLLHELAHIRRNDYLVNLLQNMAETIFFFNPGLLWVSAVLKQEREHCCDDIALAHTHRKKQFIEALVSFTKYSLYGSAYTTAFPGTKNHLLQRVKRITQNRNNSLSGAEKIFFLLSLFACFFLAGMLGSKQAVVQGKDTLVYYVTEKQKEIIFPEKEQVQVKQKKMLKPSESAEPQIVNDEPWQEPVFANAVYVEKKHAYNHQVQAYTAIKYEEPREKYPVEEIQTREQLVKDAELVEVARRQAELDRKQADKDRAQAELDRLQAIRDREQADKDREQAERNRMQADRDRAQAEIDRRQADKDRQQAYKNK